MSTATADFARRGAIANLKLDEDNGRAGMWLVITTEAFLFTDLFFSYFYLGNRTQRWQVEQRPALGNPLTLLAILLTSSIVLELLGERNLRRRNYGLAKLGVAVTILLGIVFLGIEGWGFAQTWQQFTPDTNSYGSIYYTILFFHASHVIVGLLMLTAVLFLPPGPTDRTPHRPLHCASLYWHFVDVIWVFVITFLYIVPHLQ